MTDAQAWQSTLHAAVLAPEPDASPRVLVLPEGDGWALPSVVLPEQVWLPECGPIIAAVREQLGVDAVVLRRAEARVDEERREVEAVYLLEPRTAAWAPPEAARFVGRAALPGLQLARPAQRAVLDRCLAELAAPAPWAGSQPWTRRGWLATAASWIDAHLERLHRTATGPVEQRFNWGISCVLRVPTDAGAVYFKAIPVDGGQAAGTGPPGSPDGLLFANEPALIAALAARFPDHVPAPLAIDPERRWLLLPDVGPPLAEQGDYLLWEAAVRAFARLQVASAGLADELLAAGCLDRRLETLPDQIAPLLADPSCAAAVGEDELARLRELTPRLRSACADLARVGLPAALVHGDLHAGNVAVRDGVVTFFDWTDGCVAHPFVDAGFLPANAARRFGEPEAGARLREVYLEAWTAFAPIDRLREAVALAEPVVALHHAISYCHIVANVDPVSRGELGGGLRWSLRDLLASLSPAEAPPS